MAVSAPTGDPSKKTPTNTQYLQPTWKQYRTAIETAVDKVNKSCHSYTGTLPSLVSQLAKQGIFPGAELSEGMRLFCSNCKHAAKYGLVFAVPYDVIVWLNECINSFSEKISFDNLKNLADASLKLIRDVAFLTLFFVKDFAFGVVGIFGAVGNAASFAHELVVLDKDVKAYESAAGKGKKWQASGLNPERVQKQQERYKLLSIAKSVTSIAGAALSLVAFFFACAPYMLAGVLLSVTGKVLSISKTCYKQTMDITIFDKEREGAPLGSYKPAKTFMPVAVG